MLRETLRRFDERIDIDQYLPEAPAQDKPNPEMLAQEVQQLKMHVQELTQQLEKAQEQVEKGYVQAASQIATSSNPLISGQAFGIALQALFAMENGGETPGMPGESSDIQPPTSGPPQQPTAALP